MINIRWITKFFNDRYYIYGDTDYKIRDLFISLHPNIWFRIQFYCTDGYHIQFYCTDGYHILFNINLEYDDKYYH